jgi:dTDP-4-dehydrorhamnose reductase
MVGAVKERVAMTVFICGSTGRLGRSVTKVFEKEAKVVAPARQELDLRSKDDLQEAVEASQPSILINCAAWTDVDGCEKNPELAKEINATLPQHLSELSKKVGAHLVHISTDFVFDGRTDTPYNEKQLPNPLSVYGQTKLDGEIGVGPNATIIRTSWLQSQDDSNMVEWILDSFKKTGPVEVPNDRRANPTFVSDLLPVIKYFAELRYEGVVHATNQGTTNWCEFARFVAEKSDNDPARIIPSEAEKLNRVAERPVFSALDNAVIREEKIEPLRHHQDAVLGLLRQR